MRAIAALALVLLAALPGLAPAAVTCFDFTTTPRWLGFARTAIQAVDVLVEGDLAYLACRTGGIVVVDVTDPKGPVEIGNLGGTAWSGVADDLAKRGDHLYVGDGNNRLLHVVDVSDPAAPALVGQVPTGELPRGIDLAGDRLYAAIQYEGVEVFDLADPLAPAPVDTIPVYSPLDVTVAAGLLYVPNSGSSLPIYDVSSPDEPVFLRSVSVPHEDETWHVAARGGYAYVAGPASLWELDVSDPSDIVLVRTIPQWAFSVAVDDRCLYLATDGLEIWDPAEPAPTGPVSYLPQLVTGGLNLLEHAEVAGGLVFAAAGRAGLAVGDISPQLPPPVQQVLPLPRPPGRMRQRDGWLLAAGGDTGLLVYDLHDLQHPNQVGQFPSQDAMDFVWEGDLVYLADGPGGLVVVDVGNPYLPAEVGRFDPIWEVSGVDVAGGRAYLANERDGLLVVDVTDPAAPFLVGEVETADNANAVVVAGDHAFVAAEAAGVQVVDVSDPAAPAVVATVDVVWRHETLALRGTTLYASGIDEDLVALDVSAPTAPVVIGRLPLGADDLLALGNLLVVAADGGVTFIDATDPAAPAGIGFLPTWEGTSAVAHHGNVVFAGGANLLATEMPCSMGPSGVPAAGRGGMRVTGSPNPFNPRLEIAYELDRAQTATLEVVDLAGRRLAVLATGAHAAGGHVARWDGRDRQGNR